MDSANNNTPDREMAERFLALLDEEAEGYTFQTFDDDLDRRAPQRAHIYHGTLSDCWDGLCHQSGLGAGVFVAVNATNLRGRKKADMVRARALWQEADRGDEPALPVEPHVIVESSPGKHHRYVLTETTDLTQWERVQRRMVRDYGSDPAAADVARVLRLPGFPHQKRSEAKGLAGVPHMVCIVHESGAQPMPWARVLGTFPPVPAPRKPPKPRSGAEVDGLDMPLLLSALGHIDPDAGYGTWLSVGAGLHHGTHGSTDGLALWDEFSTRGSKYRTGECEYRWGTFSLTRRGSQKVATIARVYALARESGWDGEYDLGAPGVEDAIPGEYHRRLDEFNRRHAVVLEAGKAVIAYRLHRVDMDDWLTEFSDVRSIRTMLENRFLPRVRLRAKTKKLDWVQLFPTWLKWAKRREYHQIVFQPRTGIVARDDVLPDGQALNLYQGLSVAPVPGDCRLIRDHIMEVWCRYDRAAYDYVLGWLASMFQCPGERGHTALVLRSGEGSGKGVVIDALVRALGSHATVCTSSEELAGRWTSQLATSVLVVANESTWGGNRAEEGRLKALITDPTIKYERKYITPFALRNCVHLIVSSNADWVVPVGLDDRRFFVLDVGHTRVEQYDYFRRLARHIDDGGGAALLDYLLQYDLRDFDARIMPPTQSATKLDNKLRTADTPTQWIAHVLMLGVIRGPAERGSWIEGPNHKGELLSRGWDEQSIQIRQADVYDAYARWCRDTGARAVLMNSLTLKLKERIGVSYIRQTTLDSDGTRPYMYQFPSLTACRGAMDRELNQLGPWHHGDKSARMRMAASEC